MRDSRRRWFRENLDLFYGCPSSFQFFLDMEEVRRYFALFDREDLLEALKDGR